MTITLRFAAAAALTALSLGCQSAESGPLLETRIATGEIAGVAQGDVAAYLGIQFAAPPTGEMRWRSPAPPAPYSELYHADAFGPSCIQKRYAKGTDNRPWTVEYIVDGESEFSEDCLYVNVWTTAKSTDERMPVLFFIHGGGFVEGSGSVPLYDGAALARRGIVVVNVNYRVKAFGFLAHPELSAESPSSASGNYAIEDLIAALGWVRDNIAAFGGDPSQVTISGQSAGSSAVHSLIASPQAKGLFVRAIAQSGSGRRRSRATLAQAEDNGVQFMKAAGVASLAELRALSPEELLAVDVTGLRFGPIVDGAVIPASPAEAQASGAYNDTPILTGYTADEASSREQYGKATAAEHAANIERFYGEMKDQFLAAYPAADDGAAGEMSKSIGRDRTFASMYQWAVDRLKTTKHPIYCYMYTHVKPGPESDLFGAFHASELAYVFDNLDKAPHRPFTDEDREIADKMASYWTNFIKTGDPNGADLPPWPAVDVASKQVMELGAAFAPQPVLDPEKLALFEAFAASSH